MATNRLSGGMRTRAPCASSPRRLPEVWWICQETSRGSPGTLGRSVLVPWEGAAVSFRGMCVVGAVLAVALPAVATAQEAGMEDPGAAPWAPVPRDQIAAQCGLDPDVLDQASPQLQTTPFVVIRHGKLCWEGGEQPNGTTETYSVYSVTKTFGAMLFGMVSDRSS